MDPEFPDASQLKLQTRNYENDSIGKSKTKILTKLLGLIQKKSKKGKYELFTDLATIDIQRFLKDKGYKIFEKFGNSYCTISWK